MRGTRQEVVGDMLTLSEMITIFEEGDCRIQEMELSPPPDDILGAEELSAVVADLRGQQRMMQERTLQLLQRMIAFQEGEEL